MNLSIALRGFSTESSVHYLIQIHRPINTSQKQNLLKMTSIALYHWTRGGRLRPISTGYRYGKRLNVDENI